MDSKQKKAISTYIKEVSSLFEGGRATELSYRSCLERLLKSLLQEVEIIHEAKKIKCGAPDYEIWDNAIPLGHIEAKRIEERLDAKQHQEQFERYSRALDNIIFTNYLTFRHVRENNIEAEVAIAKIENGKIKASNENFPKLYELTQAFREHPDNFFLISSPKDLAKLMARKSHLLADAVKEILEDEKIASDLRGQAKSFRELLIEVTDEEFADMYAQTIVYGMFAARLNGDTQEAFSRLQAAENIPATSPLLKNFFQNIVGFGIDPHIKRMVDNLAHVFDRIDMPALLDKFNFQDMEKDPFIHFYEPFLEQYDSKLRKRRGVYYTPWQVVSFIVRGVDDILKKEFNLSMGLADSSKIKVEEFSDQEGHPKNKEIHRVQILDPAAGTGTFLSRVISLIRESFSQQEGTWPDYVRENLIPRLHGFEVMMAPYAMAHLKIGMSLQQGNANQKDDKDLPRLRMFLTDALNQRHKKSGVQFAQWLTEEAKEANQIKTNMPVMVILGNPPYKGESKNNESWIRALMEDYKKESDGTKLRDKTKWINNDYVKFIRCAQDYIGRNEGGGVLAFITDHGYLSNPTFRGMRSSLLRSFDEIRVLDLHGGGGNKKNEQAPDGSLDENVFSIQQGVAISFFIKKAKNLSNDKAKVKHSDLYGSRQYKYGYLVEESLDSVGFKEINPEEPEFLFIPMSYDLKEEYDKGFSVDELFPVKTSAIRTARDEFTIHHSKQKLQQTIEKFLDMNDDEARKYFSIRPDTRDWTVHGARQDLESNNGPNFKKIRPVLYRPFDERYTYYTGKSKGFHCVPGSKVIHHFLAGENIGLVTVKSSRSINWCEVFVSNEMVSGCTAIHYDQNTCYPLYCYPSDTMRIESDADHRKPNLNNDLVQEIADQLGMHFVPEKQSSNNKAFAPIDLLDYIYAVLYSPSYRKKYNDYLKRGFPRVPYPLNKQFNRLVELGARLRSLHLMKDKKLDNLITTYPQIGSNIIEKVQREKDEVHINATQFFGKVPEEAWNACIGKYQPAQKWLEDREGLALSYNDIKHYQKIIVALVETGKIMKSIDKILAPST